MISIATPIVYLCKSSDPCIDSNFDEATLPDGRESVARMTPIDTSTTEICEVD
jgi:hypothetical protein